MSGSFIADLLRRLAPQIGAAVHLEPEHERIGYLTFADGSRSFFRDNRFSLNDVGSVRVAQDKDYSTYFLRHFGYRVPKGITFWEKRRFQGARKRRSIDDALRFASRVKYPVFVKPNDRSQGAGVAKVWDASGLRKAAAAVFALSDVAVVQEAVRGRDYRIVVLEGQVISAYERRPLQITGDGTSTVRQLLEARQQQYLQQGRDTTIRIDARIKANLQRSGLRLSSILPRNRTVKLHDIANLSTGGDAIDITNTLHPTFAKLATSVAKDLCLRICGVDLIAPDATKPLSQYAILEVNSAPGLDHYALPDAKAQEQLVDQLYLKLLRALEGRYRSKT